MTPLQPMQASRTALIAAVFRGRHRELHAAPWVFDDPHAPALVGPQSAELWAQLCELFPAPLCDQVVASICARSRFVEDRLAAGSFDQYVLLGAGLDSFAWRRPKPLATVSVFEIDHPASQQAKRDRIAELGLPNCDRHVFAPCDFETETLAGCLDAAGFNWSRPALFGWLGVTMYLTREAIEATCRLVARCAPGTQLALSYAVATGHADADGERLSELFSPLAERSGEPIVSRLAPLEAEALLTRCGLLVVDHPCHEELRTRYFAGRADGLRPAAAERVLAAGPRASGAGPSGGLTTAARTAPRRARELGEREVGEERDRLARVEADRMAVARDARRSEQRDPDGHGTTMSAPYGLDVLRPDRRALGSVAHPPPAGVDWLPKRRKEPI